MSHPRFIPALTALGIVGLLTAAMAPPALADDPKFKYAGEDEATKKVKKVAWAASAQAGLIVTTGNSRTTSFSGGALASRRAGDNKLMLELSGGYARSSIFVPNDVDGDGSLSEGEIDTLTRTSARAWTAKGRYDRFLTKHNSLYAAAFLSADEPAGKELIAGGQLGYSRQLYKTDDHEIVAETGYDLRHEDLAAGDAVQIHSARVFFGYAGKLAPETGLTASAENLINVNELDTATGTVDPFEDYRLTGVLAVTTKLADDISLRSSFTMQYDNAPAPRPTIGLPYAEGFQPAADELDTKTELSIIINFL